MQRYTLHTLGTVSLRGPAPRDAIALDEPRLIALVVLLAVAGDAGEPDDELLLRLTPSETAERGRIELARLIAVLRQRLGADTSLVRTADGWAFAPGLVTMDVRLRADDAVMECAAFLEGFKLPGSPEFREWLAATRRRVEPRTALHVEPHVEPHDGAGTVAATVPSEAARQRTKVDRRLVAVAVLILIVAGGAFLRAARSTHALALGDALLVANVQNETGDSLFDISIARATTVALQQSQRVQLYPRSQLAAVYQRMQIGNLDTALTFDLAQEVALRERIRFVLGLRIVRSGDGYRVSGQLADVATPTRMTETSAIAPTRDGVIGALDEVLIATRRQMGESRTDVRANTASLPAVTTSSLEALRSFAEGSSAWSRGDFTLARELWQRAVDIDTGFAMAYSALGSSHYYNHERDAGERYFGEALKRAGRLSDRERLQLLTSLAQYRGSIDTAVSTSRLLAERYPGVSTWYSHGTMLMQAQRDSEAITAFHTALRYDSTHTSSYINLATTARRMRRDDDALAYYARADRFDSLVLYRNNINPEWGATLVSRGRVAEADSAFRRMAAGARVADRALGFRSRGYLALWRGHPDEAIGYFRQAIEATVQIKSPLGEARNRMLLAAAYRTAGRDGDASSEVTRTLALVEAPVMEPFALAMVATSCIRSGRVVDAERVLKLLRTRVRRQNGADTASEAYVAGLISIARGRPDSALHQARRAQLLPQQSLRLALQAEAHRLLGQSDSARAVVMQLLDDRGFGTEGQEDWLRAPLVLGDLLRAQHDTAGALNAYQRLLDQWREAQPGLPDLIAARGRIAALRSRSDQRRQ